MIDIIDDDNKTIGKYLIKSLQADGQSLSSQKFSITDLEMYGFLGQLSFPNVSCPEGYFLGPLTEEENQLATSQGQWFNNVGRPADIAKEYHKQCIQRLDAIAAYHNQDPTTPVAWKVQWAHNSAIGNLFTVETHRQKGLAAAILAEACRRILAKGDLPECRVLEGNAISINLLSKLGFSPIGKATKLVMHA